MERRLSRVIKNWVAVCTGLPKTRFVLGFSHIYVCEVAKGLNERVVVRCALRTSERNYRSLISLLAKRTRRQHSSGLCSSVGRSATREY